MPSRSPVCLLARVPSKGAFGYMRVTALCGRRDRAIARKSAGCVSGQAASPTNAARWVSLRSTHPTKLFLIIVVQHATVGACQVGDEVIRVGDVCDFNGRVGSVEDISLRSTRIRTVERTELSIPNGSLATMNVENLSRRDKFLFNPKIGLRYETTPDQLRYVLAEARRLLYEHPKVETASARIRFAGLEASWLGLEIFSYILTRDAAEFNAIREDILLRLMDIVYDAGTGFAFPSQTLYLGRDPKPDEAKAKEAEERVNRWREEKQLPFPDFAPAEISEFRDSLPYPPPDSAVNNQKG